MWDRTAAEICGNLPSGDTDCQPNREGSILVIGYALFRLVGAALLIIALAVAPFLVGSLLRH
jgi:hypothetical protein